MPSRPSPSSSVQAARQALADRLREIRIEAGLSAREVSRQAGWHPAKTSRIEHAVQPASPDDIRLWCELCDAAEQAEDLIASARIAEGAYVEWRRVERTGLRRLQESYVPLYERTRLFRVYQSHVLPGLLQTGDYAAALLSSIARFRQIPDDADQAAEQRIHRAKVVTSGRARFMFLIEEPVLQYAVAPLDVMLAQLDHLTEVSALNTVALGVIPLSARERPMWTLEGFTVFDDSMARVELLTAKVTVTAPGELATYVRAFEQMRALAVFGKAARDLIASAREMFV